MNIKRHLTIILIFAAVFCFAFRAGAAPAKDKPDQGGDQFGHQIGLGREIAINRAGGDTGALGDIGDLHRGHAAFGSRIPRRRQNGAAPRREAFYNLMSPPIDHGRVSHPCTPPRGLSNRPEGGRVQCFLAISKNRFEELNNYSGGLTSRK